MRAWGSVRASTSAIFFEVSTIKAGYFWHRFEKCVESNLFECEEVVAVDSGNYSEIPNNSGSQQVGQLLRIP